MGSDKNNENNPEDESMNANGENSTPEQPEMKSGITGEELVTGNDNLEKRTSTHAFSEEVEENRTPESAKNGLLNYLKYTVKGIYTSIPRITAAVNQSNTTLEQNSAKLEQNSAKLDEIKTYMQNIDNVVTLNFARLGDIKRQVEQNGVTLDVIDTQGKQSYNFLGRTVKIGAIVGFAVGAGYVISEVLRGVFSGGDGGPTNQDILDAFAKFPAAQVQLVEGETQLDYNAFITRLDETREAIKGISEQITGVENKLTSIEEDSDSTGNVAPNPDDEGRRTGEDLIKLTNEQQLNVTLRDYDQSFVNTLKNTMIERDGKTTSIHNALLENYDGLYTHHIAFGQFIRANSLEKIPFVLYNRFETFNHPITDEKVNAQTYADLVFQSYLTVNRIGDVNGCDNLSLAVDQYNDGGITEADLNNRVYTAINQRAHANLELIKLEEKVLFVPEDVNYYNEDKDENDKVVRESDFAKDFDNFRTQPEPDKKGIGQAIEDCKNLTGRAFEYLVGDSN